MQELINWVVANWQRLVEVILAIIGLASVIVKITPTTKDDAILQKIKDFLSKWIALNPTIPPK